MIEKMTQAGAEIIRELKGNPLVLALLLLNLMMLVGFWYALSSVATAGERRDVMLKACIERGQTSSFDRPRLQSDESKPFVLPPLLKLPPTEKEP
jgi:hypothetical protein